MEYKDKHDEKFFFENNSHRNNDLILEIIDYKKPKKNRFKFIKFLIPFTAIVTFLYMYIENFLYSPSNYKGNMVSIENNTSIDKIAKILTKNMLSKNAFLCKIAIYIFSLSGNHVFPGKYTFQNHISLIDALTNLFEGQSINYKITFKEGLTSEEIVSILNEESKFSGEIITNIPDEGSLMPDTYFYTKSNTRESILKNMLNAMSLFLEKEFIKKDDLCHLQTKEEVINLASIVEKEASNKDERKLIAYILLKRLKKNMRLQVDAPFLYKTNVKKVLFKHLKQEGDYNTYKSNGLPKTAICNPSRESVLAVLHPTKNDYLFYIATGKGTHFFSKTFEEHVKYRKKIQAQKAIIK